MQASHGQRTDRQAARRRAGMGARRGARGQSLVEFALMLPVVLTLVVGGLDLARAYQKQVQLEGAVRAAAERVARDTAMSTSATAQAEAQKWICRYLGLADTCTVATVTVPTFTSSTSSPGTSTTPLITITVSATLPFSTLVPYPLLTKAGGTITLRAGSTFSFLRGLAP